MNIVRGILMVVKDLVVSIDAREDKRNIKAVSKQLENNNIKWNQKQLLTGDYLSDDVVIELKFSLDDFASSIMDGRLIRQSDRLMEMKQPIKVIIIPDTNFSKMYSKINKNSIIGMRSSLISKGITLLHDRMGRGELAKTITSIFLKSYEKRDLRENNNSERKDYKKILEDK
jgi:ERCC4-type nuclease